VHPSEVLVESGSEESSDSESEESSSEEETIESFKAKGNKRKSLGISKAIQSLAPTNDMSLDSSMDLDSSYDQDSSFEVNDKKKGRKRKTVAATIEAPKLKQRRKSVKG
jgi:hypothetical protein